MGRHKKFLNLGAVRLIKKYGNRKLYDTQTGHYIVLGDIAKLVTAGENVVVMEHKEPSKDITGETLILAFAEMLKGEKGLNSHQAVSKLKDMIKGHKPLWEQTESPESEGGTVTPLPTKDPEVA